MKKYLFKHPTSYYCYIAKDKEEYQKEYPDETCIGTIEVEEEKKMVTKEIRPAMIMTEKRIEIVTSDYIPINAKNVKIVYEVEE